MRGRTLDNLKRYEEALASYDKAIEIDPNDSWAWGRRSWTRSIPTLISDTVSDKTAQIWLEVWQDFVESRPEFQITLRLLKAGVRYRLTKGDRRVLLELPIEERNLLKPLLGLGESSN